MLILKRIINKVVGVFYKSYVRSQIKNYDFTIIANNCWGGYIYQDLKIEYKTPTAGLFFTAADFIKFVSRLKHYTEQELLFVEKSRYAAQNENRENNSLDYPIALIDDVEIHFLHYHSETEAAQKWKKRCQRIVWNNLYIKMDDQNQCAPQLVEEFDRLPFEKKLFFSAKPYASLNSVIYLPHYKNQDCVGDFNVDRVAFLTKFNIVKFLRR